MSSVPLWPYFLAVLAGIAWAAARLVSEAPTLSRAAHRQVARWRRRRRSAMLPTLTSDVLVIPRPRTPAAEESVQPGRPAPGAVRVQT